MKTFFLAIGIFLTGFMGVLQAQAGAALEFDAVDDIVNVPSSTSLESYGTTNELTIEYWVNPDPTLNYVPTPTQPQVFEPLISKRYTSNTTGILIDKLTAAGIHTHWLRFSTGWQRVDVPYTPSTWNHVALTYKTGSGMRVYVNGTLVGTNPISGNLAVNNAPFQIGGETAVYGYKYGGKIDEVRMWNRALTPTEIMDGMICELTPPQTGLVAYYQFNEGVAGGSNPTVTTLPDLSGNGNNGALQNFALSGTSSNWIAPGGVVSGVACFVDPCLNDITNPTIICNNNVANITVNNDPGACGAVVNYGVAPSDNCGIDFVQQNSGFPNATLHPVGTTVNSFTAFDAAG